MPARCAATRRWAYIAAIGGLALLASVVALFYAGSARTESGGKSFKAGVKIGDTKLYCSGEDDRVYLITKAAYGKPVGRSRRVRKTAVGEVKARVLKRKGSRRALATASDRDRIDFKARQRDVSRSHRIRFGARHSKRILLHAYGKTNCEDRRSNELLVKLVVTEKATPSRSSGNGIKRGQMQRGRQSSLRRIAYRPCISDRGPSCPEPPAKDEEQVPDRRDGLPESTGAGTGRDTGESAGGGTDPEAEVNCVPPEQLGGQQAPYNSDYSQRYHVGTVEPAEINEASGLASSRKNDGILWLHNDSGDAARIFAINTSGTLLATYSIDGAAAVDWEDIAIGPGPEPGTDYLYIADIGDNAARRGSVTLYRVEEPSVSSTQEPLNGSLPLSDSIQIDYPDGARDAESLFIDPQNGDAYVVSKRELLSRIYSLPSDRWDNPSSTLSYTGQLTWGGAVGGDISPGGDEILLKSYGSVFLYRRADGTGIPDALSGSATSLPYTAEPQGESIAFCGQGTGYFTVSEGLNQPLYYYR